MELTSLEHFVSAARIKVLGVGGGGGNAVQNMIDSALRGVSFICANTDVQALNRSTAETKIQLGERLTQGLGAGANPAVGRDAALESVAAIKECLSDADMVFVTAGMGGGTGTGAAPVIAQVAKELGALTVGVVTKPFTLEGARRRASAEAGIAEFRKHVDCLITIPNDRLFTFAPKKAPFSEMLKKANDILYYAVKGISDVIMIEGLFNLDFADVRAVMSESGHALMGTGVASGENRAREATTRAITSPLLDDVSIDGAKAVLYNITANRDILTEEIEEIGTLIHDAVHPEVNVFMGMVYDDDAGDELRLTVIATGIDVVQKPGVQIPAGNVTQFPPPGLTPQTPLASPAGSPYRPRRPLVPYTDETGESPAYLRKLQALGRQQAHAPGTTDFIFDQDESEVPAFIRYTAD